MVVLQDPADGEKEAKTYGNGLEGGSRGQIFDAPAIIAVARHGKEKEGDDSNMAIRIAKRTPSS